MEVVIIEISGTTYTTTIVNHQEEIDNQILLLETDLSNMTEPTEEELVMDGKMVHPYYMIIEQINNLK